MPMTFGQFWAAQHLDLPIVPTASTVRGGTYIVTGGNTGLGLQCAKHLVRLTAGRVIISSRSAANGAAAVAEIESETGIRGVAESWPLDLADFATVRAFARRAVAELDRLDAVVENASVALDTWSVSEGMETSVAVNIVGTVLLGLLLFPKLQETAKKHGIVPHLAVVASAAGFDSAGHLEKVDGDILKAFNTKGAVGMFPRYEDSKLLQMYIIRELAARLPYSKTGVVINYLNPGLCNTGLSRNASLGRKVMIKTLNMILGRTAEMGSRTLLHGLAAEPESHGKFCSECRIADDLLPDWMTNESGKEIQKRLWNELSQIMESVEPGCLTRVVSQAR